MSATFTWDGLQELRDALRNLPSELTGEGRTIIEGHGARAVASIIAGYPEKSGKLKRGVAVSTIEGSGQFFAGVIVRNKVKYAGWYEFGTASRHTAAGWPRGAVPKSSPGRVFVPAMERERRAMWPDLRGLLERNGLVASGDGG
jgi:hypothetical protein